MPLPASSTTLKGLITAGSMNRMTRLDVVVEHVACLDAAAWARRRGNRVRRHHVADLADAGVAGQRKRLAPDHLDAVVFASGCATR